MLWIAFILNDSAPHPTASSAPVLSISVVSTGCSEAESKGGGEVRVVDGRGACQPVNAEETRVHVHRPAINCYFFINRDRDPSLTLPHRAFHTRRSSTLCKPKPLFPRERERMHSQAALWAINTDFSQACLSSTKLTTLQTDPLGEKMPEFLKSLYSGFIMTE